MFTLYREGPKVPRAKIGRADSPQGVKAALVMLKSAWESTKPGRRFAVSGIDGLAKWSDGTVAFAVEADPDVPKGRSVT